MVPRPTSTLLGNILQRYTQNLLCRRGITAWDLKASENKPQVDLENFIDYVNDWPQCSGNSYCNLKKIDALRP